MNLAVLHRTMGRLALSWLSLLFALWLQPALAQSSNAADPPTRAGRVADVIGDAWLFDAETKEWLKLLRNQTVAEGDRLRTDDRARVALRIGSTSLWLDERSNLEFNRLDDSQVLLKLDKGDLGLRLRSQEAVNEFKVQTREGRVSAESPGQYRVEQIDRGSLAYVYQGRLRFESGRAGDVPPVWLSAGEQAEFWWAGGPRTERQRLQNDSFGDWMQAQSRQEGDNLGSSQRYVSPEMTGAEDLDRYGQWSQSPEYGNVWIPSQVGSDWAPYRDGRWVWTNQWGWSWVDASPWGFAPFHYGRWVNWQGRWAWSPGSYVARPVYAPALVAWGGGSGLTIGISIGSRSSPPRQGWYPLAPREVYMPSYRHSPAYVERVNIGHKPELVQRPHLNRDFGAVISSPGGQGGALRPENRPERQTGPARIDQGLQQPAQRPAVEAPRAADLPWRSDNRRDRDAQRPAQQASPQAAPVTESPRLVPPLQQLQPPQLQQVQPQRPAEPRVETLPRAVEQNNNERGIERNFPIRAPAQDRPIEQRQIERQPERARTPEMPQARPPADVRVAPQQPAAQQPQPPQRVEDKRRKPDVPGRGDKRDKEVER